MPCGFYKRTPEIKAKNSIATKKLWEDSEYRKNFKGNSGHHHSEFTKRKMSESHKGKCLLEETKRKMSESNIGKSHPNIQGEKHPRWLGGISKFPYAFDFDIELKDLIKRRDKCTCQLCQKKKWKKNLCVHHIDYNKQNSAPENLITLCRSCHSETNSDRKVWVKFFSQKLKFA